MTEEYELSSFDRHSLNFDNVALGRLPTSVTTDPSVKPLREFGYLPKKIMDPHEIPDSTMRAGNLPAEVLDWMKKETNQTEVSKSGAKDLNEGDSV